MGLGKWFKKQIKKLVKRYIKIEVDSEISDLISQGLQELAAEKLVDEHFDAIKGTLRRKGYDTDRDFEVARIASERLITHIL